MKERIKKSISVLSVIIFGIIVLRQVIAPVLIRGASSTSSIKITSVESDQIFNSFGGQKGDLPITMFVTSWCGVCKALEEALGNAGVKFVKADVEKSRDAYLYYQQVVKGQTSGVPVTVVGTEVFIGYDISNIARAIRGLKKSQNIKA